MGEIRNSFGTVEKLNSGRWRAYYKHHGMRHKAPKPFGKKGSAQAWLDAEEQLIVFDKWTPPAQREREQAEQARRTEITVGQWVERYHDSMTGVRRSTLQTYRNTTKNRITEPQGDNLDSKVRELADIPLVELTKADVHEWWYALQKSFDTSETNRKAYVRLKAAMGEAVHQELILRNPVDVRKASHKKQGTEKYLPKDEELRAILEHMADRYKALTVLIFFHGLRIGEAIALERKHVLVSDSMQPGAMPTVRVKVVQNAQRIVDGGKTSMVIQPPKTTAAERTVPIMEEFVPIMLEHLKTHAPSQPTLVQEGDTMRELELFTATAKGGIVFDTSYRSVLSRVKTSADVHQDIDPHCGRNWLITRLAEQGAHLKEIGTLLGQQDIETILKVYMKARAERTDSLMEMVNGTLVTDPSPVRSLDERRAAKEA